MAKKIESAEFVIRLHNNNIGISEWFIAKDGEFIKHGNCFTQLSQSSKQKLMDVFNEYLSLVKAQEGIDE